MFKAAAALILLAVLAVASISCGSDEPSGPRTRLVLEPVEGLLVEDMDAALDDAIRVIDRRLDAFGLEDSKVERSGDDSIVVLVKTADAEEAERILAKTGLLQFCEPVVDEAGNVAVLLGGSVSYKPGTCEPERDEAGNILTVPPFFVESSPPEPPEPPQPPKSPIEFVPWARMGAPGQAANPRDDEIVWQPATATIDGEEVTLDGTYLLPTTSVFITGTVIQQPTLIFEFEGDGVSALEQVTERLSERNYPIGMFLDGEPIRDSNGLVIAPQVIAELTSGQGTITGLSEEAANDLSMLLNGGAYPIPLRIVEISEVLD